jgi:hypothetical protein
LADALQVTLPQLNRLLGVVAPIELNGHSVPGWLTHYESLVEAAGTVQLVETVAIPGLLQTRAYAGAVERLGPRDLTEQQIAERVEVRLARQRVLHRQPEPLRLVAVIGEKVLHDTVGGPAVMAAQLKYLLDVSSWDNIEIRVLPNNGSTIAARGGLELLTAPGKRQPFMVVTIDIDGPRYEERDHVLAPFQVRYDHLLTVALPATESLDTIDHIKEQYHHEAELA